MDDILFEPLNCKQSLSFIFLSLDIIIDINIRYQIPAYLAIIFQNIKSGTENTDKQNEYKYTK
jgi:hypothetical protein